MSNEKTLLESLLTVLVGFVFWMIFIWLCVVASLIYLALVI